MNKYKIYLVNKEGSSQKFWCFLSKPESEISPEVYANSNTFLTVPPYTGSQENSFTIPLQYIVKVGASNNAVGLQTRIQSSVTENTKLREAWEAKYIQKRGEKIGPTLHKAGTAPEGTLNITTNTYDKSAESLNNWYGNMTYGVQSEEGFIGITWSPDPARTYEIKPKVTFYVAIGSFSSNTLADINRISSNAAMVTEDDFNGHEECTVTRKSNGSWSVTPGRPSRTAELDVANLLINAHLNLTEAHKSFTQLMVDNSKKALISVKNPIVEEEYRISAGVEIYESEDQAVFLSPIRKGILYIVTPLSFASLWIFSKGIKLKIKKPEAGKTSYEFEFDGSRTKPEAVLKAFAQSLRVLFTNNEPK